MRRDIQHVLQQQHSLPKEVGATGDLTLLLTAIQTTCKFIATNVRRAGLLNLMGAAGTTNVQGEGQKKVSLRVGVVRAHELTRVWQLDILSNEIMVNSLKASGKTSVLVSEELDDPVIIEDKYRGKYCVCFDPLDGSSSACSPHCGVGSSSQRRCRH